MIAFHFHLTAQNYFLQKQKLVLILIKISISFFQQNPINYMHMLWLSNNTVSVLFKGTLMRSSVWMSLKWYIISKQPAPLKNTPKSKIYKITSGIFRMWIWPAYLHGSYYLHHFREVRIEASRDETMAYHSSA